jgi:hypothetical protein
MSFYFRIESYPSFLGSPHKKNPKKGDVVNFRTRQRRAIGASFLDIFHNLAAKLSDHE